MRRSLLLLAVTLALPLSAHAQAAPTALAVADGPGVTASPLTHAAVARRAQRRVEQSLVVSPSIALQVTAAQPNGNVPLPADGFVSSGFAQFMSSPAGRVLRVVAGAGMIAGGIAADSDGGTVLAGVGSIPLLAGTFDFCVLSPLFGGPFWGRDIRAAK
ncbi:MAG: DUF2892 domain-containing protein [Gemmatimonadaceae bacterium]|jgi:hypothetical protein|nr:DUF2892 domain-containing protein [Gemmatimonadaceae bacterium]